MANYLWHRISESERTKIESDSKELILEFGDALEKLPEMSETPIERENDRREEKEKTEKNCDEDFRELMLHNAPEVKDDSIIAEKGKWEE